LGAALQIQLPSALSRRPPTCHLCGGASEYLFQQNGFDIERCSSCGFMFADLPDWIDLPAIYEDHGCWAAYDRQWAEMERFYLARLKHLERFSSPGRMLEIGAAAGYFLRAASTRGWDVSGIEISAAMRQACQRNADCDVFSSIDDARASGEVADCLIAFDVLEHVPRPAALLLQARSLLRSGGLIAISTPNFEGQDARLSPAEFFAPPQHVSYFSPETLSACIESAGFEVLEQRGLFSVHELPLPRMIESALRALRPGKRIRPHGLLGRALRACQKRHATSEHWRAIEIYARKLA